jgi:predicted metal-dependent phosphoesterase TrpH
VLVDFHTHTSASDGALAPADLIERALEHGIDILSLTDHDTVAGYMAVKDDPRLALGGLRLIPGVEFSCQWSGATIHVVGLGIDCDHPAMRDALVTMAAARQSRGEKIGRRLARLGFEGGLQGALTEAGESQLGRPHFAQWMAQQGHVKDHNEAFDKYLGQGKVGDVKAFWPELAQVVRWITGSGGVPVLAHPYKYKFTAMKLRRLIVAFVESGGCALEIQSGRQTPEQFQQLKRYANEYLLEVSVGSDFHRDYSYGAPLGVDLAALPRAGELRGVWSRFMD